LIHDYRFTDIEVFTTEYLPHKVKVAKQNITDAGLSDYVEFLEGNAREI